MTNKKYLAIKKHLSAIMQELEDVPLHEQQIVTGLTCSVQEQLTEMSRGFNKLVNRGLKKFGEQYTSK